MVYTDFVLQSWDQKQKNLNLLTYYYFEGGFSKEECELIKNYFYENTVLEEGTIIGAPIENYRTSNVSWLEYFPDSPLAWVFDRLGFYCTDANNSIWNFDLIGMTECLQFTHYDSEKQGRYKKHTDIGGGFFHRKISIVVQLDDPEDYTGGDLLIYPGDAALNAPKKQGDVILFPSYLIHEVTPLTSGERRSLVCWVSGPVWR